MINEFTLHFRQPRRRLKLQRSQWRLLQPKLRLNLKLKQEQRKAKPHPWMTTPPKVANMQHHQQLRISNHQTRHQRNVWKGSNPIHPVFQLLLLTKTMHKSSKNCKRLWFDVVFLLVFFMFVLNVEVFNQESILMYNIVSQLNFDRCGGKQEDASRDGCLQKGEVTRRPRHSPT